MNNQQWRSFTSPDEVKRRAGGRRHYNNWRHAVREVRRLQVARLLNRYPIGRRGTVLAIARELGVHPSTVCRDLAAILEQHPPCPLCGQMPRLAVQEEGFDTVLDQILADAQAEGRWAARGPLPRLGE